MTDLAERLRNVQTFIGVAELRIEAADEIERLRASNEEAKINIADWQASSEAYRMDAERLRAALRDIHEHAIMGHDDAADGFIKLAGMARDVLLRGET